MDRLDEIRSAVPNPKAFEYDSHDTLGLHENWTFIAGARWADNHPSEETIVKICKMYCHMYAIDTDIEVGDGDAEWIKEHWND